MSFSLSVPRQENYTDFEEAAMNAVASPKPDARTKVGKRQRLFVDVGVDTLLTFACQYAYEDQALSGTVSGHVNPDGSGNLNVTLVLPK
jgi:hypothetical protein